MTDIAAAKQTLTVLAFLEAVFNTPTKLRSLYFATASCNRGPPLTHGCSSKKRTFKTLSQRHKKPSTSATACDALETPMKKLFSLHDLLCEQLRDLYDAEENYSRHLPNFIKTATSNELRQQFLTITQNTVDNLAYLANLCAELRVPPQGITCEAMEGLIREAKDSSSDWGDTATIDAALISNAQRIVHYEIAGFGTAKEFARCLGLKTIHKQLHTLLQHAFQTDQSLTKIATGGWFSSGINDEAAQSAA